MVAAATRCSIACYGLRVRRPPFRGAGRPVLHCCATSETRPVAGDLGLPGPRNPLQRIPYEEDSGSVPACGGSCALCAQASHSLPCTPAALSAAQELVETMEQHGRLDFEAEIPDKRFELDEMWTRGPGRMLGVLVCRDGGGQVQVLRAFSGQMANSWHVPGWCGPVCTVTHEHPTYRESRRRVEVLSARIADARAAGDGPSVTTLRQQRRAESHALLDTIQASYLTRSVAGDPLCLADVYERITERSGGSYRGQGRFPAGTGDCCAPKLLHAAAARGWRPEALVEFWYGSAPRENTPAAAGRAARGGAAGGAGGAVAPSRVHGVVYGPCDRCQAILGTMLHGMTP